MTDVLRETLEERGRATPWEDVDALVAAGDRRVRRRRVAGVVAVAAVVAVLAVVTPIALGGLASRQGRVATEGADAVPVDVSWSVGTTVVLGDDEVTLPSEPLAWVVVDDGIVWVDGQDDVNLTAGRRTWRIGTVDTTQYGQMVVSEGSLAAWFDGAAFVVVDTDSRAAVRRVPVTVDERTDPEFAGPTVRALDGGVVWTYAEDQITGVDVSTGDVVDSFAARGAEDLADVTDGYLVRSAPGGGDSVVDPDGSVVGTVPDGVRETLSPKARYVTSDAADSERVYEVSSGQEVTPYQGRDYHGIVQWLDEDTYQGFIVESLTGPDGDRDGPVDIVVCSVSAGSCELVGEDVFTFDAGARGGLPIGEPVT